MSRSSGHALSQVLVLGTPKTSASDAPPGASSATGAADDLGRELRVARQEWARAVDDQVRLQDAAEAARSVSVAEAEARIDAEEKLAKAAARIAGLEGALAAAACARAEVERELAQATTRIAGLEAILAEALRREQTDLALAAVRALRGVKDGLLLPPASVRRSLYDKALGSIKGRFGLKAGR